MEEKSRAQLKNVKKHPLKKKKFNGIVAGSLSLFFIKDLLKVDFDRKKRFHKQVTQLKCNHTVKST